MATPIINNLALPEYRILVLLDEDSQTTGTITHRSIMGGGYFKVYSTIGISEEYDHVLFAKEMATEVEVDGIEYMAMHEDAIVGLIP